MIVREQRIGNQRLILGDCLEVMPTLGKVGALVTDPPFGMAFRSNHRQKKWGFIEADSESWPIDLAVNFGADHSKYIWMRWDNLRDIPKPRSLITWVKNNHSMGDLSGEHGRMTEVCAFYRGPNHYFPGPRPTDVIFAPRTGNDNHPTEKPVRLMRAVVEWTAGNVFDPFMGSGTTLVACQKLGRYGTGIEIDPDYFEIACRRVDEAARQPDLLIPETQPKPEQLGMFGGENG